MRGVRCDGLARERDAQALLWQVPAIDVPQQGGRSCRGVLRAMRDRHRPVRYVLEVRAEAAGGHTHVPTLSGS